MWWSAPAAMSGVQVYVASTPVDFRKGAIGLMALVRDGGAESVQWRALRIPFEKSGPDQSGLVRRHRGVFICQDT